jgi:hypothetical protein
MTLQRMKWSASGARLRDDAMARGIDELREPGSSATATSMARGDHRHASPARPPARP